MLHNERIKSIGETKITNAKACASWYSLFSLLVQYTSLQKVQDEASIFFKK